MLHAMVEDAFDDLLARWREHQRRRASPGAHAADLAESRRRLDEARERVRRFRLAMYPDPTERDATVASMFCDTLGEIVHVGWRQRDASGPSRFRCPCGGVVELATPSAGAGAHDSTEHRPRR